MTEGPNVGHPRRFTGLLGRIGLVGGPGRARFGGSRGRTPAADGEVTDGSSAGGSPLRLRAHVAAVSVRAAMRLGGLIGFTIGLAIGSFAGALLVWFAGAVLDWQRQLSFTLGVARTLLPFAEQNEILRDISLRWYLVVPGVALAAAALAAMFGALVAGVVAAAYDRSPRSAEMLLELDEREVVAASESDVAAAQVTASAGTADGAAGGPADGGSERTGDLVGPE